LTSANVLAIPDQGVFHADGELGFDWAFDFAATHVAVRSLKTSMDVAGTGQPFVLRLLGSFEVAGLRASVGLTVGTQLTPTAATRRGPTPSRSRWARTSGWERSYRPWPSSTTTCASATPGWSSATCAPPRRPTPTPAPASARSPLPAPPFYGWPTPTPPPR